MPPINAAAVMGVIPPVNSTVEARRFTEFKASMIALARGAPRGTRLNSKACSYTWIRMPVRVVADGRRQVSRGKVSNIWT
jgi:hypothetical protein